MWRCSTQPDVSKDVPVFLLALALRPPGARNTANAGRRIALVISLDDPAAPPRDPGNDTRAMHVEYDSMNYHSYVVIDVY